MTIAKPGTIITDESQLREQWLAMMQGWSFEKRSLWLIFVEHDRSVAPVVIPIDGLPPEPDEEALARITDLVSQARDELGVASTPMLLSRPGSEEMTPSDRRWARVLRAASCDQVPHWPIHLATGEGVQVFAPDDLL